MTLKTFHILNFCIEDLETAEKTTGVDVAVDTIGKVHIDLGGTKITTDYNGACDLITAFERAVKKINSLSSHGSSKYVDPYEEYNPNDPSNW